MGEKLTFKATIDENNLLTIWDGEADSRVLSQKVINRSGQKSSFTYKGEKIDWVSDVRDQGKWSTPSVRVFLYPINLNYTNNPLEVEHV